MFRALKYLPIFFIPGSAWLALELKGVWSFSPIILGFVIVPLLDALLGPDSSNLKNSARDIARRNPFYDFLLYLVSVAHFVLLGWFLSEFFSMDESWWERIGLVTSAGMMCGVIGINVAHELGHRTRASEQLLAKALLLTSQYMHFFIEHNRGHHRNVGTDEDPASAYHGESIYAFWLRSVRDSYRSAWNIQNKILQKKGQLFFSFTNDMLWYLVIQLGFLVFITWYFNWQTLLLYLAASIMGFLLLETVNYIEHYGLRRTKVSEFRYENVQPAHSWNSDHLLGRLMLFELTRHSDHHFMPQKKYQLLDSMEEAPQLPTGYPGMMLLSLVPPLWFKVMNQHIHLEKES